MELTPLHPWNLSPTEALAVQKSLRDQLVSTPYKGTPKLVAGADISFNKYSPTVYAAFVILDYKTQEVIDRASAVVDVQFPYIPGLLSFREIPPLIEAWKKLNTEPDVVIFDGQGIAHPRRLGIAAHMGLLIQRPTIGCGKSKLTGKFDEPDEEPGSRSSLIAQGEEVGVVFRTKKRTKPIFISPGNKMDTESAVRIVAGCVRGYRIPEPTRQAHLYVNELRRAELS